MNNYHLMPYSVVIHTEGAKILQALSVYVTQPAFYYPQVSQFLLCLTKCVFIALSSASWLLQDARVDADFYAIKLPYSV
jgi:hypothetical protein